MKIMNIILNPLRLSLKCCLVQHDAWMKRLKKVAYQTIPLLQEYVLIEQDVVDVEVCKRSEGWVSKHYFMGDELTFESLSLMLSVENLYHRVKNEDILAFYEEQKKLLETSKATRNK